MFLSPQVKQNVIIISNKHGIYEFSLREFIQVYLSTLKRPSIDPLPNFAIPMTEMRLRQNYGQPKRGQLLPIRNIIPCKKQCQQM